MNPLPTEPCIITRERVIDEGWAVALLDDPDWREDLINGAWVHVQVANDPTNARTKPCDVDKRPFDQVATGQGVENAAALTGLSQPATVYSSDEMKRLRHDEAAAERAASLYNVEAMAPRVSSAQEIPVTEEMIVSGVPVTLDWSDPPPDLLRHPTLNAIWNVIKIWDISVSEAYEGYCGATGNHAYAIYRAIAAMAPVEFVPDAELRAAALSAENAELRLRQTAMDAERTQLIDRLTKALQAAAVLRDQLAAFTTPPATDPKPFPAAALKPPKGDPRRVGG